MEIMGEVCWGKEMVNRSMAQEKCFLLDFGQGYMEVKFRLSRTLILYHLWKNYIRIKKNNNK